MAPARITLVVANALVITALAVRPVVAQVPPASPVPAGPLTEAPLADALARAAAAGKPLVIELGATWCAPCVALKELDGDPDVERARAGVVFVRYDLDAEIGGAVAARFGVATVPTELVVAADGHVVDRVTGAPDARAELVRWLVDFLDDATVHDRVAAGGPASAAERARAARVGARRALRAAVDRAVAAAGRACPRAGSPRTLDVAVSVGGRPARVRGVDAMVASPRLLGCLRRALAHARMPPVPPGGSPRISTTATLADRADDPAVRRWRRSGLPPTAAVDQIVGSKI